MKISQDSWHYVMLKSLNHYAPPNLCPYIRAVIACLFLHFFMVLAGVFLGGLVIEIIAEIYCRIAFGAWICFWFNEPDTYSTPVGMIALAMIAIVIAGCFLDHFKSVLMKKYSTNEDEPASTVEIAVAYVQSFHDKICPHLEFVEPQLVEPQLVEPHKKEVV